MYLRFERSIYFEMLANIHGSVNKIDENLPFQNLLSMLLFFYENIFLTKLFYSHISKISTLRFFFLDRFQIIFYHWNIFHGLNILTKLYKLINGTVLTVLVSFNKPFGYILVHLSTVLAKISVGSNFFLNSFLNIFGLNETLLKWGKRCITGADTGKKINLLNVSRFPDFIKCLPDFHNVSPIFH